MYIIYINVSFEFELELNWTILNSNASMRLHALVLRMCVCVRSRESASTHVRAHIFHSVNKFKCDKLRRRRIWKTNVCNSNNCYWIDRIEGYVLFDVGHRDASECMC